MAPTIDVAVLTETERPDTPTGSPINHHVPTATTGSSRTQISQGTRGTTAHQTNTETNTENLTTKHVQIRGSALAVGCLDSSTLIGAEHVPLEPLIAELPLRVEPLD